MEEESVIFTMEYYSVIKRDTVICSNMDGTGELYVQWDKQTSNVFTHLWKLKSQSQKKGKEQGSIETGKAKKEEEMRKLGKGQKKKEVLSSKAQ